MKIGHTINYKARLPNHGMRNSFDELHFGEQLVDPRRINVMVTGHSIIIVAS